MKSMASIKSSKPFQKHSREKQYGFAYVTVPNMEEAQQISRFCINKKWAACVNIYPSMTSVYSWKGKIVEDSEVVLLIKTRKDLFSDLCAALTKKHSYECPCITFVPFSDGYKAFFSWMDLQLRKINTK